ncbi:hypothetical protein PVAP13_1NG426795 [Panicum virgatum]|uniref:Histone H4 n=1 Tax=Panicum virgatum TaxID=38727 RepID=A0A8T0XCF6_PANVG|nr:hypothetical protein PVAP13_1NG426795 [Panicum virgatum]
MPTNLTPRIDPSTSTIHSNSTKTYPTLQPRSDVPNAPIHQTIPPKSSPPAQIPQSRSPPKSSPINPTPNPPLHRTWPPATARQLDNSAKSLVVAVLFLSGFGDVWARQGRQGAGQGRCQAPPQGAPRQHPPRQHPRYHQAGDREAGDEGGMKRIFGIIYEETRRVLKIFLENVIRDAVTYTENARRKTVTVMDVVYTLKRQGRTLYGFGG